MATNEHLKQVINGIKFRYNIKTQKEIASKLGYDSATYISDMIGGKSRISEDFSGRLKEVFGVNPQFLLSGEGQIWCNEEKKCQTTEEIVSKFISLLEQKDEQIKKKDEQMDRLIGIIEKRSTK